jgi:putative Mg2+ transporter-C (MgtC) family protein
MRLYFAPVILNVVKVVVAILCASLIGLQNANDDKKSVMVTLILITLGACFFMIVSITLSPLVPIEPYNVAGNVMLGILLLGTIVMIKEKATITGIENAAVIWVSGAVGLAIGTGMFVEGILITILVYFLIGWLNNRKKV